MADQSTGEFVVIHQNGFPRGNSVGTIEHLEPDTAVINTGFRKFQTAEIPSGMSVEEGNTVELTDTYTICEVIADEPVISLGDAESESSSIEAFHTNPDSISVGLEDFGGLSEVVERVKEVVELPIEESELLSNIGARPIKGVLFFGPPGTGKTHLARIIASRTGSDFYEISGPEIFNKWYGKSEELIRELFEDAAKNDRAIIFFDEIDSIAGDRAESSHDMEQRVVAQLLTMIDGFDKDNNTVVIAATNRREDLDPALLRPGRFDREVEFPYPSDQDRLEILNAQAENVSIDHSVSVESLVARTNNWTGAELELIFAEASLFAAKDGRGYLLTEDVDEGYKRAAEKRKNKQDRERDN